MIKDIWYKNKHILQKAHQVSQTCCATDANLIKRFNFKCEKMIYTHESFLKHMSHGAKS